MITIEDISLIDKFINEELTPVELHKFQERIRDDLEFSSEVRTQIHAVKGVRAYASLQFMGEIKDKMSDWKEGGHKSYTPSIDMTKIFLRIFVPAIILGLSYVIFTIVQKDHPSPVIPTEESTIQDSIYEAPAELPKADTTEMNLLRLKTDGESADIRIDVRDPKTFEVAQTGKKENVYTYVLKYDDKVDTIRSEQNNLVELLNKQVADHLSDTTKSQ